MCFKKLQNLDKTIINIQRENNVEFEICNIRFCGSKTLQLFEDVEIVIGNSSMDLQETKPMWKKIGLLCDEFWTWDKTNRSNEVILSGKNCCSVLIHRFYSTSTAGARGTRILNGGRHYWELEVFQSRGTSIMFGIGTEKVCLHKNGFVNMLGMDDQSWGLSHEGLIFHNGISSKYSERFMGSSPKKIGLFFDGKSGTLSYYKDGEFLGVAFEGLNCIKEPLYPMISSTAARTRIVLVKRKREFTDLQDRCRSSIVKKLECREDVMKLQIPLKLKLFLCDGFEKNR